MGACPVAPGPVAGVARAVGVRSAGAAAAGPDSPADARRDCAGDTGPDGTGDASTDGPDGAPRPDSAGDAPGTAARPGPDIRPGPATAAGRAPGGVSPVGVWVACSAAMIRATDSGQNEPSVASVAGPRAEIIPISWAGSGRSAAFFLRQASTSWRSAGGTALRSGSVRTTRYRIDAAVPSPNGGLPVNA